MGANNNIARIRVSIIFIFSIVLVSILVYAQADAPIPPAFFYGKAAYNGKIVPVNSVITAKIDSEKRGSIKLQVPGFYGNEKGIDKLLVAGSRSSVGKNVEFYVKIPKLQEIKATQTYKWQSNTITKLDLTFNGQEIEDNSTEILEETVNSTKASFNYDTIIAGRQVLTFIENPNIPIIRLQLVTLKNLTNVTIDFEVVDAPNVPKLDGVYKYLWISAPKLKQADIKTAILRFKVPNEWLGAYNYDPTEVKLYRYSSNKWNALDTFHEGADDLDNYYRASTPGFSYFAIKAGTQQKKINQTLTQKTDTEADKDKKPEEKALALSEEAEKKETKTVNQITGLAVEKVKANPIIGVILVLVGVLIGILSTYYFVLRNKKGE